MNYTELTQTDIDKFINELDKYQKKSDYLLQNKAEITRELWRWKYKELQEEVYMKMEKILLDFKNKR